MYDGAEMLEYIAKTIPEKSKCSSKQNIRATTLSGNMKDKLEIWSGSHKIIPDSNAKFLHNKKTEKKKRRLQNKAKYKAQVIFFFLISFLIIDCNQN